MPPLTRQQTPGSIHSWWSDSNPTGATISLHAIAKPLVRFMYHRQALAFIDGNRGTPLSRASMEIYSSYLAFKYLAPSTKIAILMELTARAKAQEDARVLADSIWLREFVELLNSPNPDVCSATCLLLEELVLHEDLTIAVISSLPFADLMRIVHAGVVVQFVARLCRTAGRSDHPEPFLQCALPELLESSNAEIRISACKVLGNLALNEPRAVSVLSLVPLLSDRHAEVIKQAAHTVGRMVESRDGAQAAVDARVLDYLPKLLETSNNEMRRLACTMLGNLSRHRFTVGSVISEIPWVQLMTLLRRVKPHAFVHATKNNGVEYATKALCRLDVWTDGAQAAVQAGVLDCLPSLLRSSDSTVCIRASRFIQTFARELLQSSNAEIRISACKVLGKLALNESEAVSVLSLVPLLRRVMIPPSFPYDRHAKVTEHATYALGVIAEWPDSAQAAVDARILDYLPELLETSNNEVRRLTCTVLGNLAHHEVTVGRVISEVPWVQLMALLRRVFASHNSDVEYATEALCSLVVWVDGAQAAIQAGVLDYLPTLFQSSNSIVRIRACRLVENCARHESTSVAIVGLNNIFGHLGTLLQPAYAYFGQGQRCYLYALLALARITEWPNSVELPAVSSIVAQVSVHLTSQSPARSWRDSHGVGWIIEEAGEFGPGTHPTLVLAPDLLLLPPLVPRREEKEWPCPTDTFEDEGQESGGGRRHPVHLRGPPTPAHICKLRAETKDKTMRVRGPHNSGRWKRSGPDEPRDRRSTPPHLCFPSFSQEVLDRKILANFP
ncbi:armadillo-type protein [Mycena alexandri]|uniref:Armadillo-type protein n=1 Tax=Mycena alexandri TaxID=1745969 RepID=A0AAD6T292_9AGAR|nr:armadillo-type protein [Mycena alexandri]